jgi:hypothetical protein
MVETGAFLTVAGGLGQRAAPIVGENGIKAVRGAAGPGREAVCGRLDGRTPDSLEARPRAGRSGVRRPTADGAAGGAMA